MPVASPIDLLRLLRDQRLLETARLREAAGRMKNFDDAHGLAKDMLQRGWLTAFQVNQVLQGKGEELSLGAYVLMERIGEGGMGQVFKARHATLDRVVALKILRKDLTARADLVKRFHREIRLVASLAHANIVLAFDADQANGSHFLAMEYVDGIDLHRLVQARGPLPVRDACDFIRQAALGLQHAHERGLVHRDVKPSNLLRTNQGNVVKVLDLGLARLQESEEAESSSHLDLPAINRAQSMLTQAGRVMGTPDYISPEQARNSHTVDGRADLYSLGCTFYFLLVGRAPFAGTSFVEKLFKHQTKTAPAVEALRPEVPAAVGSIVRRLMAKKPGDRYPSAAHLAAALAARDGPPRTSTRGGRRTAVAAVPVVAADAEVRLGRRRFRPATALALLVAGLVFGAATLVGITRLPAVASWIEARPVATGAGVEATRPSRPPEMIYLSDLAEIEAQVSRGKLGKAGSLGFEDRRIMVKSLPSPKGLSAYPSRDTPGRVSYQLDRQYHVFKAMVATNDRGPRDPAADGAVVFRVLGDGQELWRSRPLQECGVSELCTVRVSGVERLELVVECFTKKPLRLYPVWVEPYLLKDLPRGTAAERGS